MSDTHRREYDAFDVQVSVLDDGAVEVSFHTGGACRVSMPWTLWLDVVEFADLSRRIGEEVPA